MGGAKCDSCLDKSDWWNGGQCTSCDCYEYLDKCKNIDGKYKSLTDFFKHLEEMYKNICKCLCKCSYTYLESHKTNFLWQKSYYFVNVSAQIC